MIKKFSRLWGEFSGGWDQQRERVGKPLRMRLDVGAREPVAALGRLATRQCDELAQIAVAGARLRQQHQPGPVGQLNLGAVHQPEVARRGVVRAQFCQRKVCAHAAGKRALVGNGQRRVLQRQRALHQYKK